jgi:hypothetical protein
MRTAFLSRKHATHVESQWKTQGPEAPRVNNVSTAFLLRYHSSFCFELFVCRGETELRCSFQPGQEWQSSASRGAQRRVVPGLLRVHVDDAVAPQQHLRWVINCTGVRGGSAHCFTLGESPLTQSPSWGQSWGNSSRLLLRGNTSARTREGDATDDKKRVLQSVTLFYEGAALQHTCRCPRTTSGRTETTNWTGGPSPRPSACRQRAA